MCAFQLFLHSVFGYRGIVLFPWHARLYDRDITPTTSDRWGKFSTRSLYLMYLFFEEIYLFILFFCAITFYVFYFYIASAMAGWNLLKITWLSITVLSFFFFLRLLHNANETLHNVFKVHTNTESQSVTACTHTIN